MTQKVYEHSDIRNEVKLALFTLIRLIGLSIVIGTVTRIILLFNEQTDILFSLFSGLKIFLLGAANDICMVTIAYFFMWLMQIFFSKSKYCSPWGYIIVAIIAISLAYVSLFNTVFDEYGSVVPKL